MTLKLGILALTTFAGFVSGCAASPPPRTPAQVQFNFNFTPQDQASLPKSLTRGAISGVAQHVGFFYAVNPDCTSDGFVQTQVKTRRLTAPWHSSRRTGTRIFQPRVMATNAIAIHGDRVHG